MTNRYSGDPNRLFKAAPTPSALPNQFDIGDGVSWLHAVAAASAQHRVSRTQTGDDLTSTVEGGSYFEVEPAGSQKELADQICLLTFTFEREEGRVPSDRDEEFWAACNRLIDAYTGPTLGSLDEVMGGISDALDDYRS